ncbi:MAG: Sigma factor, ECF-like family protein [Phycisphaerales bacterium]|nr:Sigma factor, ECF-like family protein [Phycisphaerales bacterium]
MTGHPDENRVDDTAAGAWTAADSSAGNRPKGGTPAPDERWPDVYAAVRAVAQRAMSHERVGHTLQATAVANEAFLRMRDQRGLDPADRPRFLAAAAAAVRRILVDHAHARASLKRGGANRRLTLTGLEPAAREPDGGDVDLVELDAALVRLAAISGRAARVVDLRFFGGLSEAEAAAELGVSRRAASDDWAFARAWLRRELAPAPPAGASG